MGEHIVRKAPHELLAKLTLRALAGAGKPETPKKNRQALYDVADVLERLARKPHVDIPPLLLSEADEVQAPTTVAPVLSLPSSSAGSDACAQKLNRKMKSAKKKKKKNGGNCDAGAGTEGTPPMSPLSLPKASIDVQRDRMRRKRRRALNSTTTALGAEQGRDEVAEPREDAEVAMSSSIGQKVRRRKKQR